MGVSPSRCCCDGDNDDAPHAHQMQIVGNARPIPADLPTAVFLTGEEADTDECGPSVWSAREQCHAEHTIVEGGKSEAAVPPPPPTDAEKASAFGGSLQQEAPPTAATATDKANLEKLLALPDTFEAKIVNGGGNTLGWSLGHKAGKASLHVVDVTDVGLIPSWNRQNPEKRIERGAEVLLLNGQLIDPGLSTDDLTALILDSCMARELNLVVKRSRRRK
mmetsp:Transcript_50111/g.119257  ORF Transcript_50111/g.119257 Transcript_50111/m.119257 type:complete len:220 (-) Transcript_50111:123-782(-)